MFFHPPFQPPIPSFEIAAKKTMQSLSEDYSAKVAHTRAVELHKTLYAPGKALEALSKVSTSKPFCNSNEYWFDKWVALNKRNREINNHESTKIVFNG